MREIKFRAFSIKSKKMIDLAGITSLAVESTLMTQYPKGLYLPIGDSDLILMQYTGLKDKNGVEIYEGDIIKAWLCFGPAGEEQQVYTVTIDPHGVNLQEWTFSSGLLPEVIGNIHQNPELLEISK